MARSLISFISFIAVAGLAGCTSGSGEVKLGVDIAAVKAAGVSTAVDTSIDPQADSPLKFQRVRLVVATAKVGYGGCSEDGTAVGPFAIELTGDEIENGAHREFSLGSLPSGRYRGAEIEIDSIDDAGDSDDTALDEFIASGASVLIDGTYKGETFQFAGHFLAEQGTDGEVTVDETSPVTLALAVDTSTWLLDSEGAPADPTDAAQHDALAVAICETLDTQPEDTAPSGEPGGEGKRGKGPAHGGGEHARCVEQAP